MKKNRKKHLKILRIFGLSCFVAGVIILCNNLPKKDTLILESNLAKPIVTAEKQLDEKEIKEVTSQNIPIPDEIREKMEAEEKAKKEAEAKAKAEAEKKAEEERKAKEAEQIRLAKEQTPVTSRGGGTSRSSESNETSELKSYIRNLCLNQYGWSENDVQCVYNIITKESNWKVTDKNSSSGAYGLFQSLPASKMASEGSDYLTNGHTQIRWGLKYIKNRYGTPTKAWNFWLNHKWY